MNEEGKKIIKKFVEKCNKFDESVEIKGVSVGEEYRILETVCKTLDLVEKLQKENEELKEIYRSEKKMKNEYVKLYQDLLLKENVIPIQKIKDKIEEYKNMLKTCNKAQDIDRIKAINERVLELQELIEESED